MLASPISRPAFQDARTRRVIPLPIGRAQNHLGPLRQRAPREGEIVEGGAKIGPARKLIFPRQGQLHIAQGGIGRRGGRHHTQTLPCGMVLVAQRLQPAFGFFAEIVER